MQIEPNNMVRPAGSGKNNRSWLILAAIVVVLVILGAVFREQLFDRAGGKSSAPYQAVFLTNGQVYFGKLQHKGRGYTVLKDIYYLQVTQPPLQGSTTEGQQAQQQQARLQLVKLGNELHGPVDEMSINNQQILFYEDLKEDGKVVTAIREYQKNPAGTQAPATQTPATPAPATQTPAK